MFEVGRYYTVTTGVGDGIGSSLVKVTAWKAPLLKVIGAHTEEILNTCAPYFVSAIISDATDEDLR